MAMNESDPYGDYMQPDPPPYVAPEQPSSNVTSSQQGVTDPTIKSPTPSPDPIPTNTNGSQVGGGTPWAAGSSAPSSAPPGYHWDANMASFQPNASSGATGGGLSDPAYVDNLIATWGARPGVNPSVRTDPNYWRQKILSGELGTDENYITGKFMTPEGAPAGSAPSVAGTGPAPGQFSAGTDGYSNNPAYQALYSLANARIASLQQPQSFPQLDALMQQLQQQQAVNKQRAAALAGQWGSRVTELQQPLLTQPQVVQQHALASNNLLDSRDAAIANARASQAARGFAPTSGLAADRQRQIEENATNQQAQIDARLQQGNIATDESRRNEATQLQGLITQALNGGDATSLQQQAQVADLENQLYQTDQQRQTQQLATAQIPVDLQNQGFSLASGAQSSPTSAFASLMPLIQMALTSQNNQFNQATSQSSGLSQIINSIFSSLPH